MTTIHFEDFKKTKDKGDDLKTEIYHLGLNGGGNNSNLFVCYW